MSRFLGFGQSPNSEGLLSLGWVWQTHPKQHSSPPDQQHTNRNTLHHQTNNNPLYEKGAKFGLNPVKIRSKSVKIGLNLVYMWGNRGVIVGCCFHHQVLSSKSSKNVPNGDAFLIVFVTFSTKNDILSVLVCRLSCFVFCVVFWRA